MSNADTSLKNHERNFSSLAGHRQSSFSHYLFQSAVARLEQVALMTLGEATVQLCIADLKQAVTTTWSTQEGVGEDTQDLISRDTLR